MAKLIVSALYESKSPLLSSSADERHILTQDAKIWTTRGCREHSVHRIVLELTGAEAFRITSVQIKNFGTAFVQLKVATAAQLAALKEADRRRPLSKEAAAAVFADWAVLIPWSQLCSAEQRRQWLETRAPNKCQKVRNWRAFSPFLTDCYRGVLIECAPLIDSPAGNFDVGLQWCCLYGTAAKPNDSAAAAAASASASASASAAVHRPASPALAPPSNSAASAARSPARPAAAAASSAFHDAKSSPPTASSAAAASTASTAVPQCTGHGVACVKRAIRKADSKDFGRELFLCARTPACDFKQFADGLPSREPTAAAATKADSAKRTREDNGAAAAASDAPAAKKAKTDDTAAAAAGSGAASMAD